MPGSGLAPFQRSSVHIQEDQPRFEQCCLSAQRYPDTPRQSSPLHTTETLLKLCEEGKPESRGFTLAVYNLSSSRSSLWGCFRGCSPAWSTWAQTRGKKTVFLCCKKSAGSATAAPCHSVAILILETAHSSHGWGTHSASQEVPLAAAPEELRTLVVP